LGFVIGQCLNHDLQDYGIVVIRKIGVIYGKKYFILIIGDRGELPTFTPPLVKSWP
jgi:hypothetical protein